MSELSKSRVEELRRLFDIFDNDGSGTISINEFKELFKRMNLRTSESQLHDLIAYMDRDGNGEVSFDEFLSAFADRFAKKLTRHEIHEVFDFFDKDNDGFIELKELKEALKSLGRSFPEQVIENMFKRVDEDSNGKITFEEFVKFLLEN